ncbi:MAG: extracellular catalytic domain type 1 short-chain-length polyhydroxyalkanoate depolymerase [Planctomycetota bacterium]|jgi:poly(hydroxyalkanoate) depolymerase family esterase
MGALRQLIVRGRSTRPTEWLFGPGIPAREHEFTLPWRAHPGSRRRRFVVRTPPGYDGSRPVPLVMVLHGCLQNHRQIQAVSRFDSIADRHGFITVYPFVTQYRDRRLRSCWGWWRDGEIRAGRGEVQDLWEIVEEVQAAFNIDPRRIHISGLSAGGGMAVAALVVHADRIASGGIVAGVPYSETVRAVHLPGWGGRRFKPIDRVVEAMQVAMAPAKRQRVPIFIVHSYGDRVVDVQAARNLRDAWAECLGVNTSRFARIQCGETRGIRWSHSKYGPPGRRSVIETFFIDGLGHGWSGGADGRFSYPHGPDISKKMWRFFRRHSL